MRIKVCNVGLHALALRAPSSNVLVTNTHMRSNSRTRAHTHKRIHANTHTYIIQDQELSVAKMAYSEKARIKVSPAVLLY